MNLRPYQVEAVTAIHAEWEKGNKKTLLVLPTGTGKTIVFCKLSEEMVRRGKRVLILAHRGELLDQAADKMSRATGLGCSVEKAEQTSHGEWFQITVGSVQSMMRENRLARFAPDHFDCIIVDEAHHALSESYQRVLGHFPAAYVLGVTATPDRGDMRELGEFFQSLAYEYSLPKAIKDKYLCPIKALTIPIKIDLANAQIPIYGAASTDVDICDNPMERIIVGYKNGVAMQAGDFKASDVGNALDPYLHQIAEEMVEHCRGRKTVVFLPLIATSQKMAEILRGKGLRVAEVNGMSPDRADVLRDFDAGAYDVLCNSMLLTEGWDCPSVDCIVCLRPTKIRSLYCQIIGRGTRIHPGKDHLLLLDFLWLSERHELCRPAHLIATDAEVARKMTENINEAGCPVDIEAAERQAEGDCVADREARLAEKLKEMQNRKRKLVDPLQFEMSIAAQDLANYVPAFGWEASAPTPVQKQELERAGIFPDEIDSAGKAKLLLDRVQERRGAGLTTAKQIRFLEGKGFQHVGTWHFDSARKLIDRIAGNNWRIPPGIEPATYKPKAPQHLEIAS